MQPLPLLLLILEWVAVGIVALIVGLLVSMLLARLYNFIALGVINNIFAVFGIVLRVIIDLFEWIGKNLLDNLYAIAFAGLKHAWARNKTQRTEEIARNLGALDILGASLFFVLLLILVGSDMYFAAIRLPELFHVAPPDLNPALFTPVIVLFWVSVIIAVGAVAADVFGLTHLLPPYVGAQGTLQRTVRIMALVTIALLIIAGILQGLYSWELASGSPPLPIVDASLSVFLFVLGFIATLGVGVAAPYEALAFLALIPAILRFIPTVVAFLVNVPLNLLNVAAAVVVSLYAAAAIMGLGFWNWITRTNRGNKWKLLPMTWEPRVNIGDGVKLYGI